MSGPPTKDEIIAQLVSMTAQRDDLRAAMAETENEEAERAALIRERDAARAAFAQVNATFAASTERVLALEQEIAALGRDVELLTAENESLIRAKGFRARVAMTEHEIYGLVYSIVASQSTAGEWAYQLRQRVEHGVEIAEAILDRVDAAICGSDDE